jgi:phage terminase large subunit-like protein
MIEDRADKIALLRALDEKERRRKAAPVLQYQPHQRQVAVHESIERHRIVVLTAGNRFGKSHCGGAQATAWRLGYKPWEVPGLKLESGLYPSRQKVPMVHWCRRSDGIPQRRPTRGLVVTGLSFQKGIGMICWPIIEGFMTPAERRHPKLKIVRNSQGVPMFVRFPSGDEIYFSSGEQKPKELEGGHYDWVWIDEPPPQAFWTPIWRGCTDLAARVLFTMTAVTDESPWVKDLVDESDIDIERLQGSIWDNPYISDQAKREFIAEIKNEDEIEARVHGGWAHQTHIAFRFDPAAHLCKPFQVPSQWPRTCACDPAQRRPYAFVWFAWGPNDDVYIYNEWPKELHHKMSTSGGMTVRDYAAMMKMEEAKQRIVERFLDPRFGTAHYHMHGEEQDSVEEMFASYGIDFTCDFPGTAREETGLELMRELMGWNEKQPLGPLNRPRLRVFEGCENSRLALQKSIYVPPNHKDRLVLPEKLRESYKDFRDAIRYGLLGGRPPMLGSHQASDSYISEEDWAEHNNGELV